jgi:protein-tyrosine phosphatase
MNLLKKLNITKIEIKDYKFFISGMPEECILEDFINACKIHQIKHIICACFNKTYQEKIFENNNIKLYYLPYYDGTTPSEDIINKWLNICDTVFSSNENILVHCKSGLGRAPVLVVIFLLHKYIKYYEIIELIRDKRPGTFNKIQLQFLNNYSQKLSHNKCNCNLQ